MPLAIEILLIVIGVVLLMLALIGSGISRRLMTIPKMQRAPRAVLAVLGVLLLVAGTWQLATEKEKRELTSAELGEHLPAAVDRSSCVESKQVPEGAVGLDCGTGDSTPEYFSFVMFRDVNAMQDFLDNQIDPGNLSGSSCDNRDDYKKGARFEYSLENPSLTVGDMICYEDTDSIPWVAYTDRRFNIIVQAREKDPAKFAGFLDWVTNSQPTGRSIPEPATPSASAAAQH
ncbi:MULTISPECIES: hypothetical protein [Streptomyces]|uniref:hypothetical protein n=1 Tax=Streptomyces TaxID=1883 RepID=UPI00293022F2|nr:hypothetical protein [Streptomyces sp. NEAU-HV9]